MNWHRTGQCVVSRIDIKRHILTGGGKLCSAAAGEEMKKKKQIQRDLQPWDGLQTKSSTLDFNRWKLSPNERKFCRKVYTVNAPFERSEPSGKWQFSAFRFIRAAALSGTAAYHFNVAQVPIKQQPDVMLPLTTASLATFIHGASKARSLSGASGGGVKTKEKKSI